MSLKNVSQTNTIELVNQKPIKVPEKVTPELADFISCMIAEGHEQKINKDNYRLIFTNNNQNLLKIQKSRRKTI